MKYDNSIHPPMDPDALEARFGLRIGAQLNAAADALPHDITERLRFAREQALQRQRLAAQPVAAPALLPQQAGPVLALGQGGRPPRWGWLGSLLSVGGLLLGLIVIDDWQLSQQIHEAAEIDSALLADDLPPAAYSDPGFAEFLKRTADR
ncbi:DUF3619 family protein [Caldimonas tepidiphila]|uniref:DUF3619 family protein n=1 Tax=Caldimonas tepidiphila TaxID=2315841 RepID=UPI001F0BFB7B|nr:DUF3619 family protein [Caldimonas tepidiphila]